MADNFVSYHPVIYLSDTHTLSLSSEDTHVCIIFFNLFQLHQMTLLSLSAEILEVLFNFLYKQPQYDVGNSVTTFKRSLLFLLCWLVSFSSSFKFYYQLDFLRHELQHSRVQFLCCFLISYWASEPCRCMTTIVKKLWSKHLYIY